MVEKFRHRLIGATVWIALAIIFIPAIFDGAGYHSLSSMNRADTAFSGKPQFEIKNQNTAPQVDFKTIGEKLKRPSASQPEAEQDKKPASPASGSSTSPAQPQQTGQGAAVKAKSEQGGKSEAPAAASELQEKDKEEAAKAKSADVAAKQGGKSEAPAARSELPLPQASQASQGQPSGPWFIKEVRAFNSKNSAKVLLNQLRQAGYPAYLRTVASPEYTLFIVAIGPIEQYDLLQEVEAYLASQHAIYDIKAQPAG